MSDSTSNSDSYVLFNKSSLIAEFTVIQENSHTLLIEYSPNIFYLWLTFVISLGVTVIFAYIQTTYVCISVFFPIVAIYALIDHRPIHCTINKQNERFHYWRGGMFGLDFDCQDVSGEIEDIYQLEMKKHINRGSDTFQVLLLLNTYKRLPLSYKYLKFGECQTLAERIQGFFDENIPIRAVD